MGEHAKPQRIQLRRTKGWRLQEASLALNGLPAVKVDRSTIFGNPFPLDAVGRERAVDLFRRWIDGPMSTYEASELSKLRGKNLACWCPLPAEGEPDLCHASVLLELAAREKP